MLALGAIAFFILFLPGILAACREDEIPEWQDDSWFEEDSWYGD